MRAMMALRANVLAKGFSGIRRSTLDLLIAALNARVHPVVPSRGSVGATARSSSGRTEPRSVGSR